MVIDVDVVSDAICPWCFVGKRRLERAIAAVQGKHEIRVHWKPFELNPGMPKEGMGRREYRERKFGSEQVVADLDRRMMAVGKKEHIPFALDKIEKTPNTFDAHRLIWWAGKSKAQDAVIDGVFRAFFTQGRDIGDRAVLADIAQEAGLDRVAADAFLESNEGVSEVRLEETKARDLGVEAVPFFMIGGRFAVAGAHEPDSFLEAFEELERIATTP
ncbi:MAG TPA: DsbA family oxidoreductase [Planctomycetota bacterium]|jgi:predicted DsbA family dithiol-disulfide isomerase|nr:DsbA family oxidoreductase [Planctomycetota bacterium]